MYFEQCNDLKTTRSLMCIPYSSDVETFHNFAPSLSRRLTPASSSATVRPCRETIRTFADKGRVVRRGDRPAHRAEDVTTTGSTVPQKRRMDDDDLYSDGLEEDFGASDEEFELGSDDDVELDVVGDEVFAPVVADRERKKTYETEFTVHTIKDIIDGQNTEISQVAGLLGCNPEHAATLLRHFKWNKERFIDQYFADPDAILAQAGVIIDDAKRPRWTVIPGFACDICCADDEGLETLALSCGHRYCRDCYEHYLTQKIAEEGESRRIQCMHAKCKLIVDERTVEMVVKPNILEKYVSDLGRSATPRQN